MSLSINKVFFSGRLTRDPKMGKTREGYPVCNVTLAQDSRRKNRRTGEWEEGDPIFLDISIWGPRGEAFESHHKKGDLAYIEGRLRYDKWPDKESGDERVKLKVDADEWQFVPGNRRREEENSSDPMPGPDDTPF